MSVNNCNDDLSNENQERYLLNVDNSAIQKSFNSFNGASADSDNQGNDNTFKYKYQI